MEAKPDRADPLPERRLARLLAAFLTTGLVFLVAPGTLLGVWNLIGISSGRSAQSVSPVWIQGHGHAQLFGWVASFMVGISLYTFPKFRGTTLKSLRIGWVMWGLWTVAVGVRWAAGILDWNWRALRPAASVAELLVAIVLIWQCSGRARHSGLWNRLISFGLFGLAVTLAYQLWALFPQGKTPLIAEPRDRILLWLALWTFTFPVVWGFSARFLPVFLGLEKPNERAANIGLGFLALAAIAGANSLLLIPAVGAACWSLRIFQPAARNPKTAGVDPRYPLFVRLAFGWLGVSVVLACFGNAPGWMGASRHAFTVGFLATLIFALGPRILPSFVNSRELWSKRLMLVALVMITAGCTLRVVAEPLAYSGILAAAWQVLPVSAILELSAVIAFAMNLGFTLALPFPAWIEPASITADLPVYWYLAAYPRTRRVLGRAGLNSLPRTSRIPRSLTLHEAAVASHADEEKLLDALRGYFTRRLARTLREKYPA